MLTNQIVNLTTAFLDLFRRMDMSSSGYVCFRPVLPLSLDRTLVGAVEVKKSIGQMSRVVMVSFGEYEKVRPDINHRLMKMINATPRNIATP